jgi:hypothetical protein
MNECDDLFQNDGEKLADGQLAEVVVTGQCRKSRVKDARDWRKVNFTICPCVKAGVEFTASC